MTIYPFGYTPQTLFFAQYIFKCLMTFMAKELNKLSTIVQEKLSLTSRELREPVILTSQHVWNDSK